MVENEQTELLNGIYIPYKMAVRVLFDVAAWRPAQDEWRAALSCLGAAERARVARFVHEIDARRSVAGRLMARRAVLLAAGRAVTREATRGVALGRTAAGKPFVARGQDGVPAGFNLNVSHHGRWVALAADCGPLVGCDVVRVEVPGRDKDVQRFFRDLRRNFTPREWAMIRARRGERAQLEQFHVHWALKESLIKAIGVGLGYDLQNAEFYYLAGGGEGGDDMPDDMPDDPVGRAMGVRIGGRADPRWRFHVQRLDGDHFVAVCYGPRGEEVEGIGLDGGDGGGCGPGGDLGAPFEVLPPGRLAFTWQ